MCKNRVYIRVVHVRRSKQRKRQMRVTTAATGRSLEVTPIILSLTRGITIRRGRTSARTKSLYVNFLSV